jgi:serine/threonine-protein kinase
MGAVWLARLRRLRQFDKLVAIKTVLPEHAADLRLRRMFLDEARVAFAVSHPNVAAILDVGDHEGMLYLVMEWIEGESVRTLERTVSGKGGRIPVAVLLRVMADACAGLHAVHEARSASGVPLEIVHRDVSPQNVLVDTAGHAKLIDFGIARSRGRLAGETTAGGPKGKARYMSPEQALGKNVDRRADVWSTGAVLYSVVEGRVPYEDESDISILRAILEKRDIPWPSTALPSPVAEVVMRCLRVEPADRYGTAADLKGALENAMRAAGVEATTTEVAAFVARTVGAELAERKARVAETLSELGDPRSRDPSAGVVDRASVPTVPAAGRVDGAKPAEEVRTFAPTTQPPASSLRARRARTRQLAAVGGAGVAAVVLGAFVLFPRPATVRATEVRTPEPEAGVAATETPGAVAASVTRVEPAAPVPGPALDAAASPSGPSARHARPQARGPSNVVPRDPLDDRH